MTDPFLWETDVTPAVARSPDLPHVNARQFERFDESVRDNSWVADEYTDEDNFSDDDFISKAHLDVLLDRIERKQADLDDAISTLREYIDMHDIE